MEPHFDVPFLRKRLTSIDTDTDCSPISFTGKMAIRNDIMVRRAE